MGEIFIVYGTGRFMYIREKSMYGRGDPDRVSVSEQDIGATEEK